jgi:predicted phage tail protein
VIRRRWTTFEGASLARELPVDRAGNVTLVWNFHHSPASGDAIESTQWLAGGVPPTWPPRSPENVRATVSGSTIHLTWSAPTSGAAPTSYTLVGRLRAGGPILATVPMGSGTSFNVTAPNGTYVVSVRAANANGAGPESPGVTVTVPQVAAPPGPPTSLAASVAGTTVSFTWSPPAAGGPVGNYVLLAGLTPAFSTAYVTVPLGATPGFVTTGVPAGTYYVRVLAQNAGGTSAPSNETVVTVGGCTPPPAPGTLIASVSGASVSLTWGAAIGAPNGYLVEAGVAAGRTDFGPFPVASTSLAATAPPGTYYVRVRAQSACGSGSASNEVTVIVP